MTQAVATETRFPRLGALVGPDGSTTFRVWAPQHRRVGLLLASERHEMSPGEAGVFEVRLPVGEGTDYRFELEDGRILPDPWSCRQPEGIRGASRVVDLAGWPAGQVAGGSWSGVGLQDLVIYELHVGTFSPEGTFEAVIPRLPELRELGVTAIEIMPIASFAGHHGWGYDGVYAFAPHEPYGGPAGFARLVDAAHALGLGVILDVVYNHLGAGADQVKAFAPYMTDRHETFWGEAIDYARRPVREWAIQNAEMWVRDYGVDGLRLDAVHAIFDDSPTHVMAELAARVRRINARTLLISEMEIGDLRPIERWGHDAQWEDALHHACHVLLTGEREGYYRAYGKVADVARELERSEGRRFVVCAQNHDQVGNRAIGDRLRGADLRLAAFCAILSRGTPMLFQGEEYDESHPFQYFTDHIDPEIARMTRDGRRREFADFSDFSAEEIPDPQDPGTFERSKLDPTGGDAAHRQYYQGLLELRRRLPDELEVTLVDEGRQLLKFRRGETELVANFSAQEQDGVAPRTGEIRQ
jgi:maltooligosyltrehalose trehalohydrolase